MGPVRFTRKARLIRSPTDSLVFGTPTLLAATLVITFVPALSLWLVDMLERFGYLQ